MLIIDYSYHLLKFHNELCIKNLGFLEGILELVSKELNHLAAILHVYAGGLDCMK